MRAPKVISRTRTRRDSCGTDADWLGDRAPGGSNRSSCRPGGLDGSRPEVLALPGSGWERGGSRHPRGRETWGVEVKAAWEWNRVHWWPGPPGRAQNFRGGIVICTGEGIGGSGIRASTRWECGNSGSGSATARKTPRSAPVPLVAAGKGRLATERCRSLNPASRQSPNGPDGHGAPAPRERTGLCLLPRFARSPAEEFVVQLDRGSHCPEGCQGGHCDWEPEPGICGVARFVRLRRLPVPPRETAGVPGGFAAPYGDWRWEFRSPVGSDAGLNPSSPLLGEISGSGECGEVIFPLQG